MSNHDGTFTYPRSEIAGAMVWLCVFALMSAMMEVVYLRAEAFGVPVPLSIVAAFAFNLVLTRTARLWTDNVAVILIPLIAWIASLLLFGTAVSVTAEMIPRDDWRTWLLLAAGIAGGGWPLAVKKCDN